MDFQLLFGQRERLSCPELIHSHRCCGGRGFYSPFLLTYAIDYGVVNVGGQEVRLLASGGKIIHPAAASFTTPA